MNDIVIKLTDHKKEVKESTFQEMVEFIINKGYVWDSYNAETDGINRQTLVFKPEKKVYKQYKRKKQ